jgi:hypothetical protein
MGFDITNFQTVAANFPVEGEVCDFNHAKVSIQTEINAEIVSLIQQIAAMSGTWPVSKEVSTKS